MRKLLLIIGILFLSYHLNGQACTVLGQTPQTAFPVCGTDTFSQKSVPVCSTHISIPTGCYNTNALYTDKNPFWYTFTCFADGTLGFQINPKTKTDDYDWQLFDVTGVQNLDAVFTDGSLMISNNWSANSGSTGTSAGNTNKTACAGNSYPNQSAMPKLTQGHIYLLLVSHFDDISQDGYSLYFNGGTASITDTLPPDLKGAKAPCDGTIIGVKLNKKMRCSTLAADGSDFKINYAGSSIKNATGIGCSSGFDMDSIVLSLNNPLPPGNYTITAVIGNDNNTILDNCGTPIPKGNTVGVTVYPLYPTAMDSMTPLINCLPDSLLLIFKKPIVCNSIAADGSDFVITGPSGVTISGAKGLCNGNGTCNTIQVNFASPIFAGGTYQLKLVTGSDGNTLLNECGMETTVNSVLNFNVKQAVSAQFTYQTNYGCKYDTVYFSHDGANGVNKWLWNLDVNLISTQQNNQIMYSTFEPRKIKLYVSNGSCTDSSMVNISFSLNDPVKAAFSAPPIICPNDTVLFINNTTGKAVSWDWDFNNGQTSSLQDPPSQKYVFDGRGKEYIVRLSVKNAVGCADTTYRMLKIVSNCYIAVPSAFTPNGDGLNDYLYPLNAYKAINLVFRVYNRYGQCIFESKDWTQKWDGKFKGIQQSAGTYVWTLDYTDNPGNKRISLKGTTVLIR